LKGAPVGAYDNKQKKNNNDRKKKSDGTFVVAFFAPKER
jgi:hypothetical protein